MTTFYNWVQKSFRVQHIALDVSQLSNVNEGDEVGIKFLNPRLYEANQHEVTQEVTA